MAVDTSLSALNGAHEAALMSCLKVYSRYIDFSTENLASGDHFAVWTLPIGAQVIAGFIQVLTVDAGGGTLSLGTGAGTGLLNAQALSSTTCVKFTAGGAQLTTAADDIDLLAGSAAITTAVIRLTALVLEPAPIATHG